MVSSQGTKAYANHAARRPTWWLLAAAPFVWDSQNYASYYDDDDDEEYDDEDEYDEDDEEESAGNLRANMMKVRLNDLVNSILNSVNGGKLQLLAEC